jgi:hypothetical protein
VGSPRSTATPHVVDREVVAGRPVTVADSPTEVLELPGIVVDVFLESAPEWPEYVDGGSTPTT